jgi:heme/copper-type cytochrome/quinol oxidase subunit 1
MTGRRYSEPLALISFANIFLGSMLTFTSMLALGVQGMPRRYYQYASVLPGLVPLHQLATVGYVFMAVGFILFFHNLVRSLRRGERAAEDPWGAMKMGLPDFHIPRRLARGAEVVG